MTSDEECVIATLRRLMDECPTGFAVGIDIRFASPRFFFQSYPQEWIDIYTAEGLLLEDPTVRWGLATSGIADWADLEADDPMRVIGRARGYGMHFGRTWASHHDGISSVGSFTKGARDFTQEEVESVSRLLERLQCALVNAEELGEEFEERMRDMSVVFSMGGSEGGPTISQ